jgi:uncharacterized protein (TIGR03435 family)
MKVRKYIEEHKSIILCTPLPYKVKKSCGPNAKLSLKDEGIGFVITFFCATVTLTVFAQSVHPKQEGAPKPEFEAVTVKLLERITPAQPMPSDPGRLRYPSVLLRNLISRAYGLTGDQIEGPAWMESQIYEVIAKLPEGASQKQIPEMLQGMLAERFGLKMHWESRMEPSYALIVGKGGLKLKRSDDAIAGVSGQDAKPAPSVFFRPPGHFEYHRRTMAEFAQSLSMSLGRQVLNLTELDGVFDIVMDVDPIDLEGMRRSAAARGLTPDSRENSTASSIFTVIQEFGLKLEPRKAPIKHLVVDHAERIPTEN